MSSATISTTEAIVKIDLEDLECSTARVSIHQDLGDAYVRNSVDFFSSADHEAQSVYATARLHNYTRLGYSEPITTSANIFAHRFTKAEAEALVAVLTNELAKL